MKDAERESQIIEALSKRKKLSKITSETRSERIEEEVISLIHTDAMRKAASKAQSTPTEVVTSGSKASIEGRSSSYEV